MYHGSVRHRSSKAQDSLVNSAVETSLRSGRSHAFSPDPITIVTTTNPLPTANPNAGRRFMASSFLLEHRYHLHPSGAASV